jgi:mono/diheme cytochrome c family protein
MSGLPIPGGVRFAVVLAAGMMLLQIGLASDTAANSIISDGKNLFEHGCITCHGPQGRGMPQSSIGFTPPSTFPDFTICNATSREPDRDWKAIITDGGPARGFSEIMPAFGGVLRPEQIDQVVAYLRSFCRQTSWPRGELNLPRALVSEKAFPEDEAVLTGAVNASGSPGTDFALTYERRFGIRDQIEASVPFSFARQESGDWHGGIGDVGLGYKRLLLSSLRSGSILSVQGEAILPTGNHTRGFGTGVLFFETFASYGQLLPKDSFFQFQSGVELPTRPEEANKAVYWRTLFGKSLIQGLGRGRLWSPMIELLADREIATGEKTNWDLLPQLQVTLSRRQHVRANVGVKFPLNDSPSRSTQVMFYLLWDWFDGGLREGWK